MAITFVRVATGSDAFGSSIVVTVPAAGFAAGNTLLFAATCQSATFNVSSITDSAGNALYQQDLRHNRASSDDVGIILSGYLTNGLTSGQTITLTLAGATGGAVSVCEFSGIASTSWLDKTQSATILFDTAYSSGATAATTQADEVCFGLNYANNSSRSFVSGGSYSEIDDVAWFTAWKTQTQYLVVSSTGAQTSTATADSAATGLAMVATYKGATPAGAQNQLAWITA